jgi:transposase
MFPGATTRVYLAPGVTDMRKSIDTLSILVAGRLEMDPFSGHLFAFCNRRKNLVKILYWDKSGFCLWMKRLEKDRFRWPDTASEVKEIDVRQLGWLLDGLDVDQASAHRPLHYTCIV